MKLTAAARRPNVSDIGSAIQVSTRDMFECLNVSVQEVNMRQLDAYETMKIGEIAVTVQFGAKPAPAIQKLTAAAGFRLLPVHYVKPLQQDVLPSSLTSEHDPGLIEAGRHIETIAYGAVIIAYSGHHRLQLAEGQGALSTHREVR